MGLRHGLLDDGVGEVGLGGLGVAGTFWLLGIETAAQVERDTLVGSLFENMVVLEVLKARYNAGKMPNLYFYRDSNGNEIDLLLASGQELIGMEIKSASTWHSSFSKGLQHFSETDHRYSNH